MKRKPHPHDPYRYSIKGRLAHHSVEIGIVLLLIFLVVRIVSPQVTGSDISAREKRLITLLREIHKAEVEVARNGGDRLLWLDELRLQSPADSRLREAREEQAPMAPLVDLLSLDGYYIALYLTDSGRDDDRAWSRQLAVADDVGTEGYGVFCWPMEYGPEFQWVFYVDRHGKLMGGGNNNGVFDGLNDPFPPVAHPLRDYLSAKKDDKEAEWFQFRSLPEVVTPKVRDSVEDEAAGEPQGEATDEPQDDEGSG
ncbi:MAG: hypothetical protein V2A76_15625 [Planctomycetota bacterium]